MILSENPRIEFTNEDNMQLMSRYADKHFELAIVDPPYGIGASKQSQSSSKVKGRKNSIVKRSTLNSKNWDNEIPSQEYFDELFRVSKNRIIWGGNYFLLPLINSWLIWNKLQVLETRSDGEMAWTSFKRPLKIVPLLQDVFKRGQNVGYNQPIIYNEPFSGKQTIHPTQKPVALYKWLLQNYAKEGDTILDTHVGSGSIMIACWELGFDFVGCELDKEYYDASVKRFREHVIANPKLFTQAQIKNEQLSLL
jgi:site-specific DNA-methyltransferase (adenine-specific)